MVMRAVPLESRLARGVLGAGAGLLVGEGLCVAMESMPALAASTRSLVILAGIAVASGYPPLLAPFSESMWQDLRAWARKPGARTAVAAALGGAAAALAWGWLSRRGLDPFTVGATPLLLYYAFVGAALGWPKRAVPAALTMLGCGMPAVLLAGVMSYDKLCNYGRAAACGDIPGFGWYLWSLTGLLALATGGLIMPLLHLLLPSLPVAAVLLLLTDRERRSLAWIVGVACVHSFLKPPDAEAPFIVDLYRFALPAASTGIAFAVMTRRQSGSLRD